MLEHCAFGAMRAMFCIDPTAGVVSYIKYLCQLTVMENGT
jgi:hypothetical protein